uniref:Uncharacterized protein n=1 Tax=Arundo donax TaxID=35708 RepID=A0A0A9FGE9_ARUDO
MLLERYPDVTLKHQHDHIYTLQFQPLRKQLKQNKSLLHHTIKDSSRSKPFPVHQNGPTSYSCTLGLDQTKTMITHLKCSAGTLIF